MLVSTDNTQRRNYVGKIAHQQLAKDMELICDIPATS
jgi:hypothetical protein